MASLHSSTLQITPSIVALSIAMVLEAWGGAWEQVPTLGLWLVCMAWASVSFLHLSALLLPSVKWGQDCA